MSGCSYKSSSNKKKVLKLENCRCIETETREFIAKLSIVKQLSQKITNVESRELRQKMFCEQQDVTQKNMFLAPLDQNDPILASPAKKKNMKLTEKR